VADKQAEWPGLSDGHQELRRRVVRRARADGRVPRPHPARRVPARPRRV